MRRTILTKCATRVLPPRTNHRDYPTVLEADDGDNFMDLTDPMMRHLRESRDVRILGKGEGELPRGQVIALEKRWERQMRGKVRAVEIAQRVKQQLKKKMEEVKEGILMGDEIPTSVQSITITHIGTMDGFDEKVNPVTISRSDALKYESELSMTLCLVSLDESQVHAVCRMRHLTSYLARVAKTQIAQETSQMQLNADRESPIIEYPIRSNIQSKNLMAKCFEICKELYDNNRVRIIARNCTNCIDSAELLLHICRVLDAVATQDDCVNPIDRSKVYATFSMGAPVFSALSASCVLIPLGEGRSSQLVDYDTMMSLANSVQVARDEAFEKELAEEGPASRVVLEESRRKMFYGAQEDFLSSKSRDQTIEARIDPWALPSTSSDIATMEMDAAMREAGNIQNLNPTADQDHLQGQHEYVRPDDLRSGVIGSEEEYTMELTPGIDGQTRVSDTVARKMSTDY